MQTTRSRIHTQLPAWLWNGDPAGFGPVAHLRLTAIRGEPKGWQLQTEESYHRRVPALLSHEVLADGASLDRLDRLDEFDVPVGVEIGAGRDVEGEFDRIRRTRPGDFAAHATISCLQVTTALHGQVGAAARNAFRSWQAVLTNGDRPLFPAVRVHSIKIDRALQFRAALPRILLRADSEQGLYDRPPANAHEHIEHFSSARDLLKGLYFLDPYLAPLLVGNAPYVWAFAAPRAGALVLFDLGVFANGTTGEPAEALQMFAPQSTTVVPPRPNVQASDLEAATRWWVHHLNDLLGIVSDPVLFARAGKLTYSPQGHLQTLLSVEQLFRHVQSILTQVRDKHARQLALFGFLDTLDGLAGRDVASACTLSVATKTLAKVQDGLSPSVAQVLLPPAQRAIAALRAVQTGFVQSLNPTTGEVRLPNKRGVYENYDLEKATALYLLVRRNATHGYGGKNDDTRRRNEALLASHNGELPDDLPLLAYLYLLRLLLDPSGLKQRCWHQICP